MELRVVKFGNLMGSPDVKDMMHRVGTGTPEADQLFDDMYEIKIALGMNGQSTSAILLDPERPDMFPALVDFSFISADPASQNDSSIQAALHVMKQNGFEPEQVKSCFVTHQHGDHFDPRLAAHLPNAKIFSDPDAGLPGATGLAPDDCPPWMVTLNTPGHGGPHASFIIDLLNENLSVAIAGDLIMSHAHYLSLEHPLAFSDQVAGKKSVEKVMAALRARPTKLKMILPGHDIGFFVE